MDVMRVRGGDCKPASFAIGRLRRMKPMLACTRLLRFHAFHGLTSIELGKPRQFGSSGDVPAIKEVANGRG